MRNINLKEIYIFLFSHAMPYLALHYITSKFYLYFMIEKLLSKIEILLYDCKWFGILITQVISSILQAVLPLETIGGLTCTIALCSGKSCLSEHLDPMEGFVGTLASHSDSVVLNLIFLKSRLIGFSELPPSSGFCVSQSL